MKNDCHKILKISYSGSVKLNMLPPDQNTIIVSIPFEIYTFIYTLVNDL